MRARKIIAPTGGIIRGKFPSRKNGRMVHYEGLLERDAILLFEMSPNIVRYREQPSSIRYPDGSRLRKYTPDFELCLITGEVVLIEIKPAKNLLKEDVNHSLSCIHLFFQRNDQAFQVITDESIRQEPRLANLRWIHKRLPRVPVSKAAGILALAHSVAELPCSIQMLNQLLRIRNVDSYSLLAMGIAQCDLDTCIQATTEINLTKESDDAWFRISKKYDF